MSSDRTVEHEIEVSGTPEQVWQAIATGQGITAWFVPTTVEERAGGAIELDFGRLGKPAPVQQTGQHIGRCDGADGGDLRGLPTGPTAGAQRGRAADRRERKRRREPDPNRGRP